MENSTRLEIMEGLIRSGGLFGDIARLYIGDHSKSDQYITECFEQCHNKSVWDLWGVMLTLDLIQYRLDLIRIPLKKVMEEQDRVRRRSII